MQIFRNLTRRTREHQKLMTQISVHEQTEKIRNYPRNQESGRLIPFGFKVYSQNDEDGIIQEIFKRIGTTNRYFVEFGCENGLETNTLFLLLQGWKGLWIEGSSKRMSAIKEKFHTKLDTGDLKVLNAFVGPENFDQLLIEHHVPKEVDLLSIDVDGNDYHIFAALKAISPRVVVIEYNAKMHVPLKWVMKYNPNHQWDGSDYFGASLKSFEQLFDSKGYSLVGCNITGINAFFVRKDLLNLKFAAPFTAENHYEPARYFLTPGFVSGHRSNFGEYEPLPVTTHSETVTVPIISETKNGHDFSAR